MSSSQDRRAEINRANSQHSTGPRSEAGKEASSRNSLKHGLASATLIVRAEDPAAFEELKTALFEEHQPATDTEALLVTEMAQSWWLTQRALRLQDECFTEFSIVEKRLALLLRYQTTHERAFHKALNTLIRLKKDRLKAEADFVSQNRPIERFTPVFRCGDEIGFNTEFGFVWGKIDPSRQNTDASPEDMPLPLDEAA